MILSTLVFLAQAPVTPALFVDEMTMRYGYGVVGTSVSAMPPVILPDPGNPLTWTCD